MTFEEWWEDVSKTKFTCLDAAKEEADFIAQETGKMQFVVHINGDKGEWFEVREMSGRRLCGCNVVYAASKGDY